MKNFTQTMFSSKRKFSKMSVSLISFLLVFLTAEFSIAQTGAIIVTSSGGTLANIPTGYSTFTVAGGLFSVLNTGTAHTGTVSVLVTADITTETGAVTLTNSTNWTSLLINPSGARTISGSVALPLIDFAGADNVTINGLNSGGNSLTISNLSTAATSGTSTIKLDTDATNNTITNCTILGSSTMTAGTNGGNIWFGAGAVTTGSDNNTISNCTIGPAGSNLPTKGIHFGGTSNTLNNSGNSIVNNSIYDYFGAAVASAGIYITTGTQDVTISGNKFYQTATRTQTTGANHSAIYITNASSTSFYSISGNTIGYSSATGTGTYNLVETIGSIFTPIYLNVGTTAATSVQGNTIKAIAVSGAGSGVSTSSPFIGVYVSSGLTTIGDVTGNTIGDMSSTGSITYTSSSTSTSDVIGMLNWGISNWTTNNNNIGGITVSNSNTGASNFYGLRCFTSLAVAWSVLGNTIGGTISNSISNTATATGSVTEGILNSAPAMTATNNTIRNITAAGGTGTGTTASLVGISNQGSSANHSITQNTIYALNNSNSGATAVVVDGIYFNASTGTNVIAKNNIHSFSAATSVASTINGVEVVGGTATYQNNMIRLGVKSDGTDLTGGHTISGIKSTGGTNNFYFNSVYVGGASVVGSAMSYAFNNSTTNTRSIRNNIFSNARSNSTGTGKHYAFIESSVTGLTINYNDYFVSGTGGVLANVVSADRASLASVQTGTTQDSNSYNGDPQFIAPAATTPDLHISASNPTPVEGTGLAIGTVTDDFDGQTRAGLTPTDIGADAGNFVPSVSACVAPTAQPTTLTFSLVTTTTISGSFTAASTPPTGYLVIRSTSSTLAGNPVDGTAYTAGNSLGGGTVIVPTGTTFTDSGLIAGTTYYYYVMSYNSGSCTGGPKYFTTSPLTNSQVTVCSAATSLVAGTVTTTGATLTWTGSGNYIVEYGAAGFTPGTGATAGTGGTIASSSATTPYALTGLSSSTTYDVYVRQACVLGGFYSANSTKATFATTCVAISSFPWLESISSATLPSCFTVSETTVGATYHWTAVSSDATHGVTSPASGTNFLALNVFNASTTYNTYNVTLPTFILDATPKQFIYNYWLGSAGSATPLLVEISSNSGTTWSTLYTHGAGTQTTTTSAWSLNTINLTAYASQTVMIRFRATSNFGSGFCNQGLDEFKIQTIPACASAPASVSATTAITATSASLNWVAATTPPASGYEYYYSTIATAPTAGTTVSGSVGAGVLTANITGLTSNTVYYFWVRSNCNGTDKSNWTGSGTFTTACGNFALNVLEGFNATSIPACWTQQTVVGTSLLTFLASNSNPTTTSPEGADYAFWNSFNVTAGNETRLVSPAITTTGVNSVDVSFQWRNNNNSSYNSGAYLNEGVQVQYSLNGTTWVNAGSLYPRNDSSLATGSAQWNLKSLTLPVAAGNQATVYVGFKFHSELGDNCALDAVTIKATPIPISITPSPSATICSGSSTTLTASSTAGYTYTWSPSIGLNTSSGAVVTASPTTTTSYTVTGVAGAMTNTQTITVIVNSTPTAITLTPSTASICPNAIQSIVALGGVYSTTPLLELANTLPTSFSLTSTSGTGTATLSSLYSEGSGSVIFNTGSTNADVQYAMNSNIDLTNASAAQLTFSHIANMEGTTISYDGGYVQYSTNGGTSWTTFPTSSYAGSGTLITTLNSVSVSGVVFSSMSYPDWISVGSGIPSNTNWKSETITIPAAALTSSQFRIRFRYTTDGSNFYNGWLLDNIRVSKTLTPFVTWSPTTALYTDAAATIPYVANANATTVYVKSATPGLTTYTALAANGTCTASNTASITVKTPVAIASASAVASPICSNATTTLTANGVVGDNATVTWWTGTGGTGTNNGTGLTLTAGPGTYYARVTGDCGIPAEASVIVGAKVDAAIANITATTNPICASATTLLTANGVVGTNAIVTWYTGAGGTGTNLGASSTLTAGPGTYYARVTGDCGIAAEANFTLNAIAAPTWANLQWPASGSICQGGTINTYGQVYLSGVTDSAGQGTGITVEFGYNTTNTDPATWANWTTASYNADSGNNDEYKFTFTPPSTGTYYYTFRYRPSNCAWQYGGYSSGGGGFWDGTTNVSGQLTVIANVTYYADADNDGYGNLAVTQLSCSGAPTGYVANNTDCDDTNATKWRTGSFYVDADGDHYTIGSAVSLCYGATTPLGYSATTLGTDCDDTRANTHPGAVEVCYDGVDNDCNGYIDNVGLPGGCIPIVSNVIPAQCGITLGLIDDQVMAVLVANAQGYRWRITKIISGLVSNDPADIQTFDTGLRVFKFTQLASYAFDTYYQIEVSVRLNNVWQPFYGTACEVKTPATTTKVLTSQCGTTLSLMTDIVYANIVSYATGYRFKVTNLLTNDVQTIDRSLREFRFNLLSSITFNTTYKVEVAVRNTDGTYLPFGQSCTITTPVFPTTSLQNSQCDYTTVSSTEMIYANLVANATAYRFSITNATLGYSYVFDTTLRAFGLNTVPGLLPATTYSVQVKVKIGGYWGEYGRICNLTTLGGVSKTEIKTETFKLFDAKAYPNPFADNFKLEVITNEEETLQIKVYDMLGKLIDNRIIEKKQIKEFEIGNDFPSGVYNVVISQGENVKNIRVIKR